MDGTASKSYLLLIISVSNWMCINVPYAAARSRFSVDPSLPFAIIQSISAGGVGITCFKRVVTDGKNSGSPFSLNR